MVNGGPQTKGRLPSYYQLDSDEAGRVVHFRDPDGQPTTLTDDAANRLTAVTNPLGHTLQLGYDGRDNLLYWEDANGNLTQRQYDGNGNLVAHTNALQQTTRYDYDAQDRLVKVTDAKGRVTQLHYDAKGRLIGLTNPLGDTPALEYDAADNLLKQVDPLGQVVAQWNYDTRANRVRQTNALGNEEQFRYDVLNRLVEVQDPLKRVTKFNYDPLNRLTQSIDALGGHSGQEFERAGNRSRLTDPNGNQTRFRWDLNGRLVEETLATGDKVSYTYQARDLLAQLTNARGQSRQFEYDAAGRLVSVTDPDGTVSFSYDKNGNVLTVTDSQGTMTRTYDALNRVTSYTEVNGNTLHYEYDEVGNLVGLTYPDGKVVHYEYDAADQLVKVTDWAGRVTRYEYDKNGRLLSETRPNGTPMSRHYNVAGQLVQQVEKEREGNLLYQVDYSYDAAGNLVKEHILPKPDAVSWSPVTMTYAAANRLATYNGPAVELDADGNLRSGPLAGEIANFRFDSRNRLVSAGETSYHYDAENQRIGVNQTRYVINSQPALSQVLVKEENGGKTFYVYGLGLIGEEREGEYRAYHFDFRGSTVALTDKTGKVVQRFQYGPYGELVKGDASVTPFLFNGKFGVMTEGNGLYYMRARFYSAEMKRFVNQDVLLGNVAVGQSLNRYAFVTGRPVNLVDPFGLFGQDDATSLALDFVPVVGSCKGVSEFILGYDPITWEPISRWVAFLGIIPGGKFLTRTGKAGEAIIFHYLIHNQEHVSILVKQGDEVVHTHQVITSSATRDTQIREVLKGMEKYVTAKIRFDLPDAEAAQKLQKQLSNLPSTGKYEINTNSCLSHACDVLRAGGSPEVPTDGKELMEEYLLKNGKME